MADAPIPPQHVQGAGGGRFLLVSGGEHASLDYRLDGDVMIIASTYTPPAARGAGVAAALMRAAIDHARAEGLGIAPICSYADAWMRRHPEHRDLLSPPSE